MKSKPATVLGRGIVLEDFSVLLLDISEKDFQATVRELAETLGWVVFTTWNSRHSPAGEPDLRLVHPHKRRMVWMELKREKGKLTSKQELAIHALQEAGEEVHVFRPSDWDEIVRVLT
mgnify:CR=1 FL=1